MTRRSERELERALESIGGDPDATRSPAIVYEHRETGEWYADESMAGEPVARDEVDPVMVLVEPAADVDTPGGSAR